ncbi:hypothetical protein CAEBREN_29607, partial [Caenorhabditis brenneri]
MRNSPIFLIMATIAFMDICSSFNAISEKMIGFYQACNICYSKSTDYFIVVIKIVVGRVRNGGRRCSTWLSLSITIIRTLVVRYPMNSTFEKLSHPTSAFYIIVGLMLSTIPINALDILQYEVGIFNENYIFKTLSNSIYLETVNSDSEVSSDEELDIEQPPLKPGLLVDPTRKLTRILPVSHVFINSVYYYPTSKSLGPNAIALAMVVDSVNFNVENATYNVVGSNGTHTKMSLATSQTEGVPTCRYTPVMAGTNTVQNVTKLEMESNGVKVEIPFKMARYTAPKPVIICISPQFVAEQWQIFMMHVHVANRFGGHLHIYLTSIIESFFELMREYERQGYITLDYWLRMKFEKTETPYFEPNENIEWRNQAGAQTDCLLQYKEAAEYIAFFDMDDILFPKNYPTYLEEFSAEWALQPSATSVFYGRREHEFIKAETLSEFSFRDLIASLRSSPTVKRGKVVVKPDRYNSTWIHFSNNEDEKT